MPNALALLSPRFEMLSYYAMILSCCWMLRPEAQLFLGKVPKRGKR